MASDEHNDEVPSTTKNSDLDRQQRSRRRLIKGIAGAAGAGAASGLLPKKWAPPLIEKSIMPVHAQSSGTIEGYWILGDDAPGRAPGNNADQGGPGPGLACGTTDNPSDKLYDDGTTMTWYATLNPPAAVTVHLDVTNNGTNYALDLGAPTSDAAASADSGDVSFGDASSSKAAFGTTPGSGSVVVTYSAPGYQDCVITLNLVDV